MTVETRLRINNYVLIIGAMKCGTTSLFNILAQHPEVAPCSFKEPQFFAWEKNYALGIDYYQDLWNWNRDRHKIAMEASTSYTKVHKTELNCAKNIALLKDKANFKFIYILRNPIDRIESECKHRVQKGYTSAKELADKPITEETIGTSRYALQLEEYYQRFDAGDILLVDFDELKSASPEWIKGICRFLEIEDSYDFSNLNNIHHNSKEKSISSNWRYQKIPFKKELSYLSAKLPFGFKKTIHQIFGSNSSSDFKLSKIQKEQIARDLREEMQLLESKYNFKSDRWNLC